MMTTAEEKSVETRRRRRGSRWPFAAAGLAVAGVLLAACGSSSPAKANTAADPKCGNGAATLTVQGSGIANGTPNLLTLTLNVNVTDATAQQALADNNTRTTAVIAALTTGGVQKKDIQTTGFSIQPNYTFKNGSEVLTGYSVNNSIVAKLRNFSNAGSVIDAASTAGGNAVQINSLSFSIEDPRALQDQARKDAVAQAVSHAGAMANAAGEQLGPVCSVKDQSAAPQPLDYAPASGTTAGLAVPSAVPLETGSQQANAQVTLIYSLVAQGKGH
jgi:uncharacterized protein YggE